MENLKRIIANNIYAYRKKAKISQKELAKKLNYSDKAISKWERAESLPDIIVLKEMTRLFGISLDTLTSEKPTEKPNKFKVFFNKIITNKLLISLISVFSVWFLAVAIFVILTIIGNIPNLWIIFIYALCCSAIILVSLACIWKNPWYNFITSNFLLLTIITAFILSFNLEKMYWLFLICIPFVFLTYIIFILRHKTYPFKRKK